MKIKLNGWAWVGGMIPLGFCMGLSFANAQEASSVPDAARARWAVAMRKMQTVVRDILIDTSQTFDRADAARAKRLQGNAKQLASLAHALNDPSMSAPDSDPSISLLAGMLERESVYASRQLQAGETIYARNTLRHLTGYCIACHTRTGIGVTFTSGASDPVVKKLKPFEQAEFLVASREFEGAFDKYLQVIQEGKQAVRSSFGWERSVHGALAIAVRVMRDPKKAEEIASLVLSAPSAPGYLKGHAKKWKASIEAWKKEPAKNHQTPAALLAEGKRLFALGQSQQEYPVDRSADVTYLRATAALHGYLSGLPRGSMEGEEGLFLLGSIYEILEEAQLWELPEIYFQACIYRAPQKAVAKDCLRRYEESVYIGYSGSSGMQIPDDVQNHLKELEQLVSGGEKKKSPIQ